MDIAFEAKNNKLTITLSGRLLGEKDANPLIELVERKLETGEAKYALLEVSNLQYVNSTGLAALLTALTKFRNAGGDICLVGVQEALSKLLAMTRLDDVFPQAESLEKAEESFDS